MSMEMNSYLGYTRIRDGTEVTPRMARFTEELAGVNPFRAARLETERAALGDAQNFKESPKLNVFPVLHHMATGLRDRVQSFTTGILQPVRGFHRA